jgi:sterol desaturase/sphingolipid hydroxylase (fatty acid hydroxylase superfamily)
MRIYDLMEALALFVGVGLFAILEKKFPARHFERKNEFVLNLVSLFVLSGSQQFMRVFWFHVLFPLERDFGLFPESIRNIPFALRFLLAFLVTDFLIYWLHRAMHEVPGMWRMHSWHHSATNLGFFSGFRSSFLHVLLLGFAQVISPVFLFRFSPVEMGWFAIVAVFIQLVGHANVDYRKLHVPDFIHQIFPTSLTHRIHHSAARAEQDSNYGSVTTFWDRIFGTFTNPRTLPDTFPLGAPSDGRSILREMIGI